MLSETMARANAACNHVSAVARATPDLRSVSTAPRCVSDRPRNLRGVGTGRRPLYCQGGRRLQTGQAHQAGVSPHQCHRLRRPHPALGDRRGLDLDHRRAADHPVRLWGAVACVARRPGTANLTCSWATARWFLAFTANVEEPPSDPPDRLARRRSRHRQSRLRQRRTLPTAARPPRATAARFAHRRRNLQRKADESGHAQTAPAQAEASAVSTEHQPRPQQADRRRGARHRAWDCPRRLEGHPRPMGLSPAAGATRELGLRPTPRLPNLQGGAGRRPGRAGRSGAHQPDLPRLPCGRSGKPPLPNRVRLHVVRGRCPRRCQRGPEHPGQGRRQPAKRLGD